MSSLISVIIPVYNAENFISETITSVINQSHTNWELILIDDGSTDQSADIIKSFLQKDARVSYYYQENSGVSAARNNGISKSQGTYISFLDADDCWKKDNLKIRLTLFNNEVDWVYGSTELIDKDGNCLNQVIEGNDQNILDSLLTWNGQVITAPSTITIKSKCVHKIKFDTNLSTAADQDFTFYLAKYFKGKYLKAPTVMYRVLNDSMSRNISLMEKDHIRVYKKAAKNNLFKNLFFKQLCFSNLYWILAGSWWKNGNNKLRGLKFILMAIIANPFSIKILFSKIK